MGLHSTVLHRSAGMVDARFPLRFSATSAVGLRCCGRGGAAGALILGVARRAPWRLPHLASPHFHRRERGERRGALSSLDHRDEPPLNGAPSLRWNGRRSFSSAFLCGRTPVRFAPQNFSGIVVLRLPEPLHPSSLDDALARLLKASANCDLKGLDRDPCPRSVAASQGDQRRAAPGGRCHGEGSRLFAVGLGSGSWRQNLRR